MDPGASGLTSDQTDQLEARERHEAAARIARRSSQSEVLLAEGQTFSGNMQSTVDLAQGRMAVIGNGKEFVLVPWRRDMARNMTVKQMGHALEQQLMASPKKDLGL